MILWKNPPPLHSLCVSLDKVDLTVDEEKKRRQHFSACVVGIKEEDIPRLLWYTKSIFWITFSRIWSWFVFLLKVAKFASVVLCGRIPIHSVPERNILQRRLEDEKKTWSGTTGKEIPACPQQLLLIRCNTLTSSKEDLNSCKVRVRSHWKGRSFLITTRFYDVVIFLIFKHFFLTELIPW